MALDSDDKATIEVLAFPLATADAEQDADTRVERLGSPELAALELLIIRRNSFDANLASASSGDDRYSAETNIQALTSRIDRLVATIRASDSITVGAAGETLLDSVDAGQAQPGISVVSTSWTNNRRG